MFHRAWNLYHWLVFMRDCVHERKGRNIPTIRKQKERLEMKEEEHYPKSNEYLCTLVNTHGFRPKADKFHDQNRDVQPGLKMIIAIIWMVIKPWIQGLTNTPWFFWMTAAFILRQTFGFCNMLMLAKKNTFLGRKSGRLGDPLFQGISSFVPLCLGTDIIRQNRRPLPYYHQSG